MRLVLVQHGQPKPREVDPDRGLTRILHEVFYCEHRKHRIFGSIFVI